jgi:aryl-alcohol dehydrogenase-like predicted oxidoreductase
VLPIQVGLAWISSRPGVAAPIVSVTRAEQLDQLVDGMRVTLTPEELMELEQPYRPRPVVGIE